jgi:hypothetical protein
MASVTKDGPALLSSAATTIRLLTAPRKDVDVASGHKGQIQPRTRASTGHAVAARPATPPAPARRGRSEATTPRPSARLDTVHEDTDVVPRSETDIKAPDSQVTSIQIKPTNVAGTTSGDDISPEVLTLSTDLTANDQYKRRALLRNIGWGATVVGGTALAVACILGITVRVDSNNLRTTARPIDQAQSLTNSINGRATGANVLFGTGAVIAATGLTFVVVF